ncbi:hypothetical protein BH23BAC1_BH23BAC1_04270 [soil metagenome]
MIGFLKRLAGTFSSQFESKQISFVTDLPEGPIYLDFDPDKLEKMLSNLLINAYKFTPTCGEVNFCASVIAEFDSGIQMEFKMKDNGIGIPTERVPHIFERFYQGDASATRTFEGTGIGLALVKELTDLHGGSITVKSSPDSGTTFTVNLTLETVGREEMAELKEKERVSIPVMKTQEIQFASINAQTRSGKNNGALPSVLIVEDNPDLRHFISQNLQALYHVLEAENGMEGYKVATKNMPDLIISDVMMPVMDGVSLSDKVKTTSGQAIFLLSYSLQGLIPKAKSPDWIPVPMPI